MIILNYAPTPGLAAEENVPNCGTKVCGAWKLCRPVLRGMTAATKIACAPSTVRVKDDFWPHLHNCRAVSKHLPRLGGSHARRRAVWHDYQVQHVLAQYLEGRRPPSQLVPGCRDQIVASCLVWRLGESADGEDCCNLSLRPPSRISSGMSSTRLAPLGPSGKFSHTTDIRNDQSRRDRAHQNRIAACYFPSVIRPGYTISVEFLTPGAIPAHA